MDITGQFHVSDASIVIKVNCLNIIVIQRSRKPRRDINTGINFRFMFLIYKFRYDKTYMLISDLINRWKSVIKFENPAGIDRTEQNDN